MEKLKKIFQKLDIYFILGLDLIMIFAFSVSRLPVWAVVLIFFLSFGIFLGFRKHYNHMKAISETSKNSVVFSPTSIKMLQKITFANGLYDKLFLPLVVITLGFFFSYNSGTFLNMFIVNYNTAVILSWIFFSLLVSLMSFKCWMLHSTIYVIKRSRIKRLTK